MITPRFLFGLTQKSKTAIHSLLHESNFCNKFYRSTLFDEPCFLVPRFWGCKPDFRSGIKLDTLALTEDHFVKLSLGAGSHKSRVSFFGTISIIYWRANFPPTLFHERDNGHQVVLSWLSVFEWNCASKLGAITVHLSNFTVNYPTLFSLKKHRFLDPKRQIPVVRTENPSPFSGILTNLHIP